MHKKKRATQLGVFGIVLILFIVLVGMEFFFPRDHREELAYSSFVDAPGGDAQAAQSDLETSQPQPNEASDTQSGSADVIASIAPDAEAGTKRATRESSKSDEPIEPAGKLFIVLDDAGASLDQVRPFLSLGIPVTIAVLPNLAQSRDVAVHVFSQQHTVFLHLPLEPFGEASPGEGAIYVGNSEQRIAELIAYNLDSVPHAIGINNHMGSRVTADPLTIGHILRVVDQHGLQFLDSRTTKDSKVEYIAHELDVAEMVSVRDVFLDHERSEDAMRAAFERGLDYARRYGKSIMIGHVTVPVLAQVLREAIPRAIDAGFQFVSMEYYHTE